jgi:tRNA A-37 threonylcarbamoyl transferase component Bud32
VERVEEARLHALDGGGTDRSDSIENVGRCESCGQEMSPGHRCSARNVTRPRGSSGSGPVVAASAETLPSPDADVEVGEQATKLMPVELAPGTLIDNYRIECKLGAGGMGTVYGATHEVIRKRAALKVLNMEHTHKVETVERFMQEARAVNEIGHPNIVDIFSTGTLEDGRAYFAMEWLHGESLGTRIKRSRLNLDEILNVIEEVADALHAAHDKGIIHRDLKPDNVFLVELPHGKHGVKLLDFGIAKLNVEGDMRIERTRTGIMMGTPLYISPEQARGKSVDHRTDIYALGALGYELIDGRPPFDADNVSEIIAMHLTQAPPSAKTMPRDVPRALRDVIVRMLSKDAALRPSLAEVRSVISHVRDGTANRLFVPTANRRRTGLVAVAAIAAAVVVAATSFAVIRYMQSDEPERVVEPSTIAAPAVTAPPPPAEPAVAPTVAEPTVVQTEARTTATDDRAAKKRRRDKKKTDPTKPKTTAPDDDHALDNPWAP